MAHSAVLAAIHELQTSFENQLLTTNVLLRELMTSFDTHLTHLESTIPRSDFLFPPYAQTKSVASVLSSCPPPSASPVINPSTAISHPPSLQHLAVPPIQLGSEIQWPLLPSGPTQPPPPTLLSRGPPLFFSPPAPSAAAATPSGHPHPFTVQDPLLPPPQPTLSPSTSPHPKAQTSTPPPLSLLYPPLPPPIPPPTTDPPPNFINTSPLLHLLPIPPPASPLLLIPPVQQITSFRPTTFAPPNWPPPIFPPPHPPPPNTPSIPPISQGFKQSSLMKAFAFVRAYEVRFVQIKYESHSLHRRPLKTSPVNSVPPLLPTPLLSVKHLSPPTSFLSSSQLQVEVSRDGMDRSFEIHIWATSQRAEPSSIKFLEPDPVVAGNGPLMTIISIQSPIEFLSSWRQFYHLFQASTSIKSYHLEDKVVFEGVGNDMPQPNLMVTTRRPKRVEGPLGLVV